MLECFDTCLCSCVSEDHYPQRSRKDPRVRAALIAGAAGYVRWLWWLIADLARYGAVTTQIVAGRELGPLQDP